MAEGTSITNLQDPDVEKLSKLLAENLANVKVTKQKKAKRRTEPTLPVDPQESAKEAGLRYVTDSSPGIRRRRTGKGFTYLSPDNRVIKDPNVLKRIKSLVIPPAWVDVWICPSPNGHMQVTGRDSRNRKQYLYHPRWKETRDSSKYDRMIEFAHAIPLIREQVEKDLALPGLPRRKVLATIVRLLEMTLIRVGNEEYAKENQSYGLTTMRDHHVKIYGSQIRFRFKGKSGKLHDVGAKDRRLATILKRCQDIPGYELFQYLDETGSAVSVDSADVNEYLREITNQDFTAKHFRTWAGTVLTGMALQAFDGVESENQARKHIKEAICMVAKLLGNTPTICRKSYIHPAIFQGYIRKDLLKAIKLKKSDKKQTIIEGLAPEEAKILAYLKKCAS